MNFGDKWRKIGGIEKLLNFAPSISGWCYFDKIISLYLYMDYDYEEWWEIQNLRMEMGSIDGKLKITLLFRDIEEFILEQSTAISGFEIVPNEDHAFGDRRNYYIFDFEEGDIRFYCRTIEILAVERTAKTAEPEIIQEEKR